MGVSEASRLGYVQRIYDRRSWKEEERIKKGTIWDRSMNKDRSLAYSTQNGSAFRRVYPQGISASHLVGYHDLRRKSAGLEAVLREYLLGQEGKNMSSWYHVFLNRIWRGEEKGQDFVSTIDTRLQQRAYMNLKKRSGAIVVLNPSTGEVLAMVSAPGFIPEKTSDNEYWQSLTSQNKLAPLFNRALSGKYPPGSIFKVVVAAAALEMGWEGKIYCGPDGYFPEGSHRPVLDLESRRRKSAGKKWKGHGWLTLENALVKSSNTFFSMLGAQLGDNTIRRYANRFGLDRSPIWNSRFTMIQAALLPAPSYFPPDKMDPVDIAWASIGQGEVLITPMQAAMIIGAIANDGVMMQPQIECNIPPRPAGRALSSAVAKKMQSLLRKVVNQGTGYRANVAGLEVAGKTGTAEIGTGTSHSWFIGFAPAGKAGIALSIIIENGGFGGVAAAEVAADLFKTAGKAGYLKRNDK